MFGNCIILACGNYLQIVEQLIVIPVISLPACGCDCVLCLHIGVGLYKLLPWQHHCARTFLCAAIGTSYILSVSSSLPMILKTTGVPRLN